MERHTWGQWSRLEIRANSPRTWDSLGWASWYHRRQQEATVVHGQRNQEEEQTLKWLEAASRLLEVRTSSIAVHLKKLCVEGQSGHMGTGWIQTQQRVACDSFSVCRTLCFLPSLWLLLDNRSCFLSLDSLWLITVHEWECYSAGPHFRQVVFWPHLRSIVSSTVPSCITLRVDSFTNAITMPLASCYFCFSDSPFPDFLCCPFAASTILLTSAYCCRLVL